MTAIIGLIDGESVWMGADGRKSLGFTHVPCQQPKMFRVGGERGEMLVGLSGNTRAGQVIANFHPPKRNGVDAAYFLTGEFAAWLHAKLESNHALEAFTEEGSKLLIAIDKRLFIMDSKFGIAETERGYDAIGGGAEVALGVLYATPDLPPRDRLQKALLAATEFCRIDGMCSRIKYASDTSSREQIAITVTAPTKS
jgi:ATP-dependent protease HslVU (ClpYQ) peptidase subunit